jgi:hypothetical protein
MTKEGRQIRRACMLGALLATCFGGFGLAEVSVHVVDDECASALVMMTVIEDADPVGSRVWTPYTEGPVEVAVNISGDFRGDLFPDLVFDPDDCVVQLTWPYRTGADGYDVVFLEVLNGVSGPYTFLTASVDLDLDPRLHASDDGTVFVTWWTDDRDDTVYLARRAAGATGWDPALPVTEPGQGGRRPSVVQHDGTVLVAYEAFGTEPGTSTVIRVAQLGSGGDFTHQTVIGTSWAGRLDPVLHSVDGWLWLDWRNGDYAFGYSRYTQGGWSEPIVIPWNDFSWVGAEAARKEIRRAVLTAEDPAEE